MSKSFADLGVPADVVTALSERGIIEPFAIQQITLSDSLDGHDICGRAPTGSGKTLAFSIPLAVGVERAKPRSPRGLVLVPTRELAAQVLEVVEPIARVRGLRATSIYGGVGFEPQLKVIRRGVDIVVATPGRLNDLIEREALTLSDVDFVVIDEADRMADMGFLPDVKRLLDQTNSKRQTLLFSATLDGDVDVLIKRYQKNPVRHEVIRDDDEEDNTLHLFWQVQRTERAHLTVSILERTGPTIVFTRTKHGADRLAGQLEREGVKAAAIHGGRTQPQRDKALAAFSQGRVHVLVATDVAARGIHVDEVHCVIHYDVPEDHKTYVHRSGRTARAGASGIVISLVEPDKVKGINQMQRLLQMPAGVIAPNFKALPDERPTRKAPVEPDVYERGQSPESSMRPPRHRGRRRSQSNGPRFDGPTGRRPRGRRGRPAA